MCPTWTSCVNHLQRLGGPCRIYPALQALPCNAPPHLRVLLKPEPNGPGRPPTTNEYRRRGITPVSYEIAVPPTPDSSAAPRSAPVHSRREHGGDVCRFVGEPSG